MLVEKQHQTKQKERKKERSKTKQNKTKGRREQGGGLLLKVKNGIKKKSRMRSRPHNLKVRGEELGDSWLIDWF